MAEAVNHPSHYAEGRKYEPIAVFDNWDAGFNIGNALKYISRAGRKSIASPIEDLKKALFYLNHEMEFRKANPNEFFHAVDCNTIDPLEVAKDWELSGNLTAVICMCRSALRSLDVYDRIYFLQSAIQYLTEEVNHLDELEKKSAKEFKENIK